MENYGKTMVLWTKLWYYTENYGTSIYEGKTMVDYKTKEKNVFIMVKTIVKYRNNLGF